MRKQEFTKYFINVSVGDVAGELLKLARNAGIDLIVVGTSDTVPVSAGESITVRPLGPVISETAIGAPCPVLIVPPALIPGLATG